MIRHTVTFTLKHKSGSAEEGTFLDAARGLAAIAGVRKFECLKEIGKKNSFDFGLSMEFTSMADYEAYNEHPIHVGFVQNRWIPEVIDFIEIDYDLEPAPGY
jgi:hypothetical protein